MVLLRKILSADYADFADFQLILRSTARFISHLQGNMNVAVRGNYVTSIFDFFNLRYLRHLRML